MRLNKRACRKLADPTWKMNLNSVLCRPASVYCEVGGKECGPSESPYLVCL